MFEYIAVRLYNERKKDGDMNERKESTESIARSLGTNGTCIVEWVTLYQALGADGLKTSPRLSAYSAKKNTMPSMITLPAKGH